MRTGKTTKFELPPFHPFFQRSWHSEIWKHVTPEARLVYLALCARYSTKLRNNGKLFLSVRKASKELGFHKDIIAQALRELEFYGFIVMSNPGSLGVVGRGKSPSWRITELPYMNEPPSYDFERHTGEEFQEQHTPAYYRRKEQRLARLMAFKARQPVSPLGSQPVSNSHKKLEPCPEHSGHPVRSTQDTSVRDTRDSLRQTQQKTVRDTQDILSVSTASEPVRAPEAKPVPAHVGRRRAELATKAEQDLLLMVTMLRKLLGNKATNTVWNNEMLTYGKGWSPRSFCRRLNTLKARQWVRMVGDGAANLKGSKAPEGALYEATDKAPDADSHERLS